MQILDNLAPLLGCKQDSKKWIPYTGYNVCKHLNIGRMMCLDLSEDKFKIGLIKYKFDNEVSLKTFEIYKQVKDYGPDILDTSYFLEARGEDGRTIHTRDMVFMYTHFNKINDSAIFDVFEEQKELKYMPYHKHIMLILLDAYSLRYTLYSHLVEGQPYDEGELRPERIERLADNIRYVKYKLGEWDANKTTDLNHHLVTLLLNLQLIKYHIVDRIILGESV
ncbi:MAG: hypothetical protein GXZ11_01320 [Tissierellia bacterium]|nr:hypothetical protein [Tissierellia bacterium]